jgi:hypothetical protein
LEPVSAYGVWRFERVCPEWAPSRRDPKNWLLFATSGHFGAEVRISGFQESAETADRRKEKKRRQIAGAFELMLFSEFATD